MTGLFRVVYFDPKERAPNMEGFNVMAANAEEAIRKTDKLKSVKHYRVEHVSCCGWSDE